jgi:hypothetical protein
MQQRHAYAMAELLLNTAHEKDSHASLHCTPLLMQDEISFRRKA